MANELDSIVQVTITRESTAIATASFSIPLILTAHTRFQERARVYTDIDSVASDFEPTDTAYIMAQKVFGQDGAVVPQIIIGRRQVDEVTATVGTAVDGGQYTLIVNGTSYTFTAQTSDDSADIAAGLASLVDAVTGFNATASGNVVTIQPTTTGTAWSINSSSNVTLANTAPTESLTAALDSVSGANDSWYVLLADTHVKADQLELANAVQSRKRIYATSTSDIAATTVATTDIGSAIQAANLNRTLGIYSPLADVEFPEAAYVGDQIAYTPGSNDWDFKQVAGASVTPLTPTQVSYLKLKNYNRMARVAGLNAMFDGNMFDGTPIDLFKVA